MQCQLCAAFGDTRFNFDGLPLETLRKHSEIHQLQNDRISIGQQKIRSSQLDILQRCFPDVNAISGRKSMNAEAEIAGGDILNDGNDIGRERQRCIRENMKVTEEASVKTQSLFDVAPPASKKRGTTPLERTRGHSLLDRQLIHGYAIRSHCYELQQEFCQNGTMSCRLCSKQLTAKSLCGLVDHATGLHSDQKLFSCRLCSKSVSSYGAVVQHINKYHQQPVANSIVNKSNQYENEIIELLTKCYGTAAKAEEKRPLLKQGSSLKKALARDAFGPDKKKIKVNKEGNNSDSKIGLGRKKCGITPVQELRKQRSLRSGSRWAVHSFAIRNRCYELRRNFGQNGRIACRLCPKGTTRCIFKVLDHATCFHFKKKLYTCQLCSKSYSAYCTVVKHINKCHQQSAVNSFVDNTKEYENEIIELLTKCYDATAKAEEEEEHQLKNGSPVKKEPATDASGQDNKNIRGNDEHIAHGVKNACIRLKEQYGSKGILKCGLCSKQLRVKRSPVYALWHVAAFHFEKNLFSCRLCSMGFSAYYHLSQHMTNVHSCSAPGNYVDHTKEYEKEIVELLTKCFGDVGNMSYEQQRLEMWFPRKKLHTNNLGTQPINESAHSRVDGIGNSDGEAMNEDVNEGDT